MVYIVLFFLSIVLTYVVKIMAHKQSIIDIPNERSSHVTPTPRGGGIAILVVFYIGLIYFQESIDNRLFYALLFSIPIALVGLIDDIITLSSKLRFFIQSISALGALYVLGGVDKIDLLYVALDGWWLNIVVFFSIIWLTNLYNFLDGIDGYASAEAVLVGLGIFLFFANPLGVVLIVANLGFLVFNWHKASIFMGDVGSATLGFIFAIFIFHDTSEGNVIIWLILLSLFWFDATLTLIRRFLNNESIVQAHKKHTYQRLVQSGWRHDTVVIASIIFNLSFLGLLLMFDNYIMIFALNLVFLTIITLYIDKKESFR